MTDLTFQIGLGFVVVGILLASAGVIVMILSEKKDGRRVRGGGVLLIGPIPIIFGTDRESVKLVIILAIALLLVVVVLMIFPYWLR